MQQAVRLLRILCLKFGLEIDVLNSFLNLILLDAWNPEKLHNAVAFSTNLQEAMVKAAVKLINTPT